LIVGASLKYEEHEISNYSPKSLRAPRSSASSARCVV